MAGSPNVAGEALLGCPSIKITAGGLPNFTAGLMATDGGPALDGLTAELPLERLSGIHDEDPAERDEAAVEDAVEVGYQMKQVPVLVRQQRARGLSFQLWPAAPALCAYLEEKYAGLMPPGCRALELGAGTGVVGIMAALLGAQVVLTDLPHVAPNLAYNVALNEAEVVRAGGSVTVRTLRWGEMEDVQQALKTLKGGQFDLILGSDVVYYDTLFEPLLTTLKWMAGVLDKSGAKAGGGLSWPVGAAGPLILLAHLRRWKKDSHFFKMASKHFQVEVAHRHPPPEGARIGVIVYALTKKAKP